MVVDRGNQGASKRGKEQYGEIYWTGLPALPGGAEKIDA
jgi:hypothetical protein